MDRFNLSEYINVANSVDASPEDGLEPVVKTAREIPAEACDFQLLCEKIKDLFFMEWDRGDSSKTTLELQKRAIIGYEKEKAFFIDKIGTLVKQLSAENTAYPDWYPDLREAVYQENWGLAGLSEWFLPEFSQSSSAKIIGSRIYFLKDGRMDLRPQTISEERKNQLIKAFLLLTPSERMDRDYYEVYLLDGTRVTVFTEPMAKSGQSAIIFRRYLVPSLTFEEQARRGTIPGAAIPLFTKMARLGFNVVFLGAVRTAKTTFLSTWQSYEDPALEGVMVETDPEIPMHKILPDAPILQLIADGDGLLKISKNLLRSDADYFILAEARDGIALDTAVKLAAKGTKRMKLTFHSRLPMHFPLEAATEIVKSTGGDLELTMQMVASGFDYLFHFIQLPDKRKKRLKGIYQMNLTSSGEIRIEQICFYDQQSESWTFKSLIGEAQREYGAESDSVLFAEFEKELTRLEKMGPVR